MKPLQETPTYILRKLLQVQTLTPEEILEVYRFTNDYDISTFQDVTLQEIIKTLNENNMTDKEILKEIKTYGELEFYHVPQDDMHYLVHGQ